MAGYLSYIAAPEESQAVLLEVKDKAAYYTEEFWQYHVFGSLEEADRFAQQNPLLHLIVWDVNDRKSMETLRRLRGGGKEPLLLVIADKRLSPTVYLRPSVSPSALLLQPLSRERIRLVFDEIFQEFLDKFGPKPEVFCAEGREGKVRIPLRRIDYFEAREGKVFVRAGREEYGFYSTLDKIEGSLPGGFLRCHRSYIVNMEQVREIDYANQIICLKNEAKVLFSRRCKKAVREYRNE